MSLVKHSQDTFPGRAGSCCSAPVSSAVGKAGRCSQLEAPPWSSCCSSRLCRTMGNPPGECAACWNPTVLGRLWCQGSPGLALGEGALPGRTRAGCCPRTLRDAPRALQHRAVQAGLQSTKGIAQQTCAREKRKIASPLLSLNRILTWCFHNSSELFAITNLSIQHL